MQVFPIGTTPGCLKHHFNGSLVAMRDSPHTNIDTLQGATLINIYRTSSQASPPSKISYKAISPTGDPLVDSEYYHGDIYTEEEDGLREDPRVSVINNQMYISFNHVVLDREGIIERTIMKHVHMPQLAPPRQDAEIQIYYNNHRIEKNWLFFEHKGDKVFLYSIYPTLDIADSKGKTVSRFSWKHPYEKEVNSRMYGVRRDYTTYNTVELFRTMRSMNDIVAFVPNTLAIRGGAPPVLVNGTYYAFAHTRETPMNLYMMMVITFDTDLKVTGYTNPIDIRHPSNPSVQPRIIYPAGAIFVQDEAMWYITCGCDDVTQVLVKMEHSHLQGLIKPLIINK